MSKCIGCGITLQNTHPEALGYTNNLANLYCQRCFKTIHYGEEKKVNNLDNNNIIDKINKLGLFTIFMTDLISLNTELIKVFQSINNAKVLVINKCDLIPANLNFQHLKENIKKVFNIKEDILFISSKKNKFLTNIVDIINQNEKVILCGETSSGKSTLINKIFKTELTTSKYDNTTLEFMKLKQDNLVIYDTPGIYIKNKKYLDNIKIYTKRLSADYLLSIDNLQLRGTGNLTIIVNDKVIIKSKKVKLDLNYENKIMGNKDIELDNGFIFIKDGINIYSNEKLNIRDSIIKN